MRRREKLRSAIAAFAALPRIDCARMFSLRGLTRRFRATARASLSASRRGADGLLIASSSARSDFLVTGMAGEGAGRRELAKLVTDHLFGHQHRQELAPVV